MLSSLGLPVLLVCTALVSAQDPAQDLPHRRPVVDDEARLVDRGLTLLAAGWEWEARRLFREVVQRDERRAAGYLGLALAMGDRPRAAANWCFRAFEQRAWAASEERAVVEAYARYFRAEARPEAADQSFDRAPTKACTTALIGELSEAALRAPDGLVARRLLARECERRAGPPRSTTDVSVHDGLQARTLRSHNAYLATTGSMPFLVPGYRSLLESVLRTSEPDAEVAAQLSRLPRHPRLGGGRAVGPMPGPRAASGTDHWQPRPAPGFDLVRGLGGRGRFAEHAGRPVLVVFFLGFG